MGEYTFAYNLDSQQKSEVVSFFYSISSPCIEQYPEWDQFNNDDSQTCHFIAKEKGEITVYANITETHGFLRTAVIRFGPLYKNYLSLISGIKEIYSFYKNRGFSTLRIQIGRIIDYSTELLEYLIRRELQIKNSFDVNSNWSSILLNLDPEIEDIFRNFSKGHKSSIKKALKENLFVTQANEIEQVNTFANIYLKMNKARGMNVEKQYGLSYFQQVFVFLNTKNLGIFLLVKDKIGNILGGVILIYQGQTVRYFKGAIDPDYRNLPILHVCIFEAIKHSKSLGKKYFDFWGYNHLVKEDDQRYNINIFKKGFGGEFVFYPKTIIIELKRLKAVIYELTLPFRKLLVFNRKNN